MVTIPKGICWALTVTMDTNEFPLTFWWSFTFCTDGFSYLYILIVDISCDMVLTTKPNMLFQIPSLWYAWNAALCFKTIICRRVHFMNKNKYQTLFRVMQRDSGSIASSPWPAIFANRRVHVPITLMVFIIYVLLKIKLYLLLVHCLFERFVNMYLFSMFVNYHTCCGLVLLFGTNCPYECRNNCQMFTIRHVWYNAFVNLQCIIQCGLEIMK